MTTTYVLIHFVWLLSDPAGAMPMRQTWAGIPSPMACEMWRIRQLSEWESRARKQKAYCAKEEET